MQQYSEALSFIQHACLEEGNLQTLRRALTQLDDFLSEETSFSNIGSVLYKIQNILMQLETESSLHMELEEYLFSLSERGLAHADSEYPYDNEP